MDKSIFEMEWLLQRFFAMEEMDLTKRRTIHQAIPSLRIFCSKQRRSGQTVLRDNDEGKTKGKKRICESFFTEVTGVSVKMDVILIVMN